MSAHLTRDDLARWHDRGDESDRARVIAHLASCDACGVLYAQFIRERLPAAGPGRFNARDFVSSGYRVYAGRRIAWKWVSLGLGAAIAGLVLAFVVAPDRPTISDRDIASAGIRSGSLEAVRPIGPQDAVTEFAWTSPVAAADYVLEVRDLNGRVISRHTVTGESFKPDAAALAQLEPGVEYRWTVSARDAHGTAVTTSREARFVLGAGPRR